MGSGYGNTRCCVEYCDGLGSFPLRLLSRLHVLLCNQHALEWRAEHRSANVQTAEAHLRWKTWLKDAGHRAWALQSRDRQALERALVEQRARLRKAELARFRAGLQAAGSSTERTITETVNTPPGSVASRALRQVAGAVRSALFGGPAPSPRRVGRLAGAMARRTTTNSG